MSGHPNLFRVTPREETVADHAPTVQEALVWGASCLKKAMVPDPRLSAEILLASVLAVRRLELIVRSDQSLNPQTWAAFRTKVFRRSRQEPIAYLTGEKEFWSLPFRVNHEVLIPRPETELLVETALSLPWPEEGTKTMVELGTGSGAVVISLLRSLPRPDTWRCLASDRSFQALAVAQENARRHGVEDTIHWVVGDWLTPFARRHRWIDLLLSNPPYISEAEFPVLPTTVRDYEPRSALSGGSDGLEALRKIIRQAADHLRIGGWMLLEMGETHGETLREWAKSFSFQPVEILKDYAGKNRVLKACYHG